MALETYTMDNGLTVCVDPMPRAEKAYVGVHVGIGSAYETSAEAGLSHIVDHCISLGTAELPDQPAVLEYEEQHGIEVQAETSYTDTRIHGSGKDVGPLLYRIGQAVMQPRFASDAVASELRLIEQEAALRYDDTRSLNLYGTYFSLFGLPYGRSTVGHRGRLDYDAEDAREFHARHYRLENMTVVAVGRVTAEAVLEHVRRSIVDVADEAAHATDVYWPPVPQYGATYTYGADTGVARNGLENVYQRLAFPFDEELHNYYQMDYAACRVAARVISRRLHIDIHTAGLAYDSGFTIRDTNDPAAWILDAHAAVSPDRSSQIAGLAMLRDALQRPASNYSDATISAALNTARDKAAYRLRSASGRSAFYSRALRRWGAAVSPHSLADQYDRLQPDGIRAAISAIVELADSATPVEHATGPEAALASLDRRLLDVSLFA